MESKSKRYAKILSESGYPGYTLKWAPDVQRECRGTWYIYKTCLGECYSSCVGNSFMLDKFVFDLRDKGYTDVKLV